MYIKIDAITYLEYSLEQMLLDVFLYSYFHWQCIELPKNQCHMQLYLNKRKSVFTMSYINSCLVIYITSS